MFLKSLIPIILENKFHKNGVEPDASHLNLNFNNLLKCSILKFKETISQQLTATLRFVAFVNIAEYCLYCLVH